MMSVRIFDMKTVILRAFEIRHKTYTSPINWRMNGVHYHCFLSKHEFITSTKRVGCKRVEDICTLTVLIVNHLSCE